MVMQSFKTFITEKSKQPTAVWVVGGAASGKSTIAESTLVKKLGFVLIDVDKPFEFYLKKFNLSPDIQKQTPEQRKKAQEKKKKEDALIKAGKLPPRKKMADYENPEDYFKDNPPTTNRASVVAREKTRRLKDTTLEKRDNVVFVETGGQIGRIRNEKKKMEEMGYKTYIVYVGPYANEDLEKPAVYKKTYDLIVKRGEKRRKSGGRGLDPKILETSLKQSVKVKKELLPLFGRNQLMIDTSSTGGLRKNQSIVLRKIRAFMR